MIPQLVVTDNEEKRNKHLNDLAAQNTISRHNIFQIIPEKGDLGIDDIRSISRIILTRIPSKRIIAVHSFETATTEAQNAFLKMLEEKNDGNVFVLFSQGIERVIPTIMSRVQIVLLDGKRKGLDEKSKGDIEGFLRNITGAGYAFLTSPFAAVPNKDEAVRTIDGLIMYYSGVLRSGNGKTASSVIRKAFQIKNNILSLNCSPQLSLDNLLIFIHKTDSMNKGHEKK